jgi:hypothetical protein
MQKYERRENFWTVWFIHSIQSVLLSKHPHFLLQRPTAWRCIGTYSPSILQPRSDDLYIWQTFETGGYLPRHGNGALMQIMATSPSSTRLSVVVTQIKPVTSVCLYIESRLVLSFPLLTYVWQADKWLLWTISVTLYVEWPHTRVMRTRWRWSGHHFASVSGYECLPNRPVVGTVWQLLTWLVVKCTVPGTVAKYAIHRESSLWELYDTRKHRG